MLRIRNLSMTIGGFSLQDICLKVEKGEYFVLAGPSGSGKSLLLETIAGIFRPSKDSSISLEGADITHTPIQRREVGLVFQDNTLFTHLNVKQNIEYALKLKYDHKRIQEKLNELCDKFGIGHLLPRHPGTLSGGEAQRVLLARAFAARPKIMLLDEPLSAVDTDQRDQLKSLLRTINRSGLTMIHVTHDFEEAFSLATTIGIMHNGRLIETGKPGEIIQKPQSKFAARFYGYKNYYQAFYLPSGQIRINNTLLEVNVQGEIEQAVAVIIDPNKVEIYSSKADYHGNGNLIKGIVTDFFNTVQGAEIKVKSTFDIHICMPQDNFRRADFRMHQMAFVHIPLDAIKLIKMS